MKLITMLSLLSLSSIVYSDTCCKKPPADTQTELESFSDTSLFHLESIWMNQEGAPFQFKDLRGNPALVTMFFASCGYACPILIEDMKSILRNLPKEHASMPCILLSFDSKRDFPPALKTFAEQRKLPSPQWTLLHAPDSSIMETAAVLGIRYRKDKEGNFAHSNIITLLNEKGEIVYQLNGLDSDSAPLIKAISEL